MSQAEPSHDVHMGDNAHVGGSVNTGSINTQGGAFIGGDQTVFILPSNDDLLNWFIEAAQRYKNNGKGLDHTMPRTLETSALLLTGQSCNSDIVSELDQIRTIMATCIAATGQRFVKVKGEGQIAVIPLLMGQAIWAVFSCKSKPVRWEAILEQMASLELIAEIKVVCGNQANLAQDQIRRHVETVVADPRHAAACGRLLDDLTDNQRGLPIVADLLTLRDGQRPSNIIDRQTWLIAVVGGAASAGLFIGGMAIGVWAANALRSLSFESEKTPQINIAPSSAQAIAPQVRTPDTDQQSSSGGKQYSPAKLYFPSLNVQRPYIVSLAELSAVRNLPPLIAQMQFCFVPEGNFFMGELQNDPDAWGEDKPQQIVYVSSFYMARYPVTIEQFSVFVQMQRYQTEVEDTRNGYVYDGKEWKTDPEASWRKPRGRGSDIAHKSKHPVTLVSARDTDQFADWLAALTDLPIRHPTEAEWEKAARGTDGRKYPWGSQLPTNQRCNFNMHERDTTSVGKYSPYGDSIYGCADMVGNVWERCGDTYRSDIYKDRSNRVTRDPFHFSYEERRVLRGGAFDYNAQDGRCAGRFVNWNSVHDFDVGVRLAVSPISLHTSGR